MGFCTNCGNETNENICANCGTAVEQTAAEVNTVEAATDKKGFIGLIIAVAAVVAIVVALIFAFGGGNYKSIAKNYVKARLNGDAEKVVSLMHKEYVDCIVEEDYDGDKDEYVESVEESLEYRIETLEDEDVDIKKIKYKVDDVDDVDKLSIEEYEEEFDDRFDADFKIKKAKTVEVEYTVLTEDGKRTYRWDVTVAKIGNSWGVISYY